MNMFILSQRQNFIQHHCYIHDSTFCAHPSLDIKTQVINNVFLVSMDVTSLYTPGGYSNTLYPRRLRPEVQPLTLIYHLDRKGILFEYLLLKNDTPFVYLVSFSRLVHSHKLICKAFWAFAQTKIGDFPNLLHSFNSVGQRTRKFTI